MLDFVDQCEEMAAAYGCLPAMILNMPWVHLRVWMEAFNKRQRREYKLQGALRNMDMAQSFGMGGGSAAPTEGRPPRLDYDLDDDRVWDKLHAAGFPVEVR